MLTKEARERVVEKLQAKEPVKPTVGEIIELLNDLNRAEANCADLEKALHGLCRVCLNNGESATDAESPCYEYGLQCLQNGYFPKCEYWEI